MPFAYSCTAGIFKEMKSTTTGITIIARMERNICLNRLIILFLTVQKYQKIAFVPYRERVILVVYFTIKIIYGIAASSRPPQRGGVAKP